MTKSEFYASIAEVADCDVLQVSGDAVLKDLPNWDSLAILSFVAMVHSKLNVTVRGADLIKCTTVDDLATLLGGKILD